LATELDTLTVTIFGEGLPCKRQKKSSKMDKISVFNARG
jgi:hypothetical protein